MSCRIYVPAVPRPNTLRSSVERVTTWKVGPLLCKDENEGDRCDIRWASWQATTISRISNNCDSGMLAALIVLQVVAKLQSQGKTFSSLIDTIVTYANSGENQFQTPAEG